jgi:hypothetical protein
MGSIHAFYSGLGVVNECLSLCKTLSLPHSLLACRLLLLLLLGLGLSAGLVQAPMKRTTHTWGFAKAGDAAPKGMAAFLDDQKAR